MSEKVCNCNGAEKRREQFKELQPVLDQYAKVPGSLITILQKAQDIYGYLSVDTINYISEATGIQTTAYRQVSRNALPGYGLSCKRS